MDIRVSLTVLLVLSVAGLYLLREGITGNLTSQSCCYGAKCSPDSMCDNLRADSRPTWTENVWLMVVGSVLAAIASYAVVMTIRSDLNERGPER